MGKRVIFENDFDRTLFFQNVLKNSNFETWKSLRIYTEVCKAVFERYKNGCYTIPFNKYGKLSGFLSKEEQDWFNEKVIFVDDNWGQKKGGVTTYQKHKEIFTKGRRLALTVLPKLKYNFDINLSLNKSICEFIGAFIGDGFTNKYGGHYLTQFTGDLRLDYEYYNKTIIPIVRSYFKVKPYIKKVDNTLRVNFCSKRLYELLTQRLKFPAGKKSYTVKIPQEILNSNKVLIAATLRGLYNTDGSIFFDKRLTYRKPYPRVYIKLINKELIKQVYLLLKSFGLKPTITKNEYVIQINGKEEVKKFLENVGFSNSRHLNRIEKWKKLI